jgi:hypothetical protein
MAKVVVNVDVVVFDPGREHRLEPLRGQLEIEGGGEAARGAQVGDDLGEPGLAGALGHRVDRKAGDVHRRFGAVDVQPGRIQWFDGFHGIPLVVLFGAI